MGQKPFFAKATAKLGQIFELAKFILHKTLKDKDFLAFCALFAQFAVTSLPRNYCN